MSESEYAGAAFFSSSVQQSVDRHFIDRFADEVVEVGEVGKLENGVVKRLDEEEPKEDKNNDPLCDTPGHVACGAK